MPANANIVFSNGTLPPGFCHENWQTTFNTFVNLMVGYLPGAYSTLNYGATEPEPEDRDKPWLKLNADGTPVGWKIYYQGEWINAFPHPLPSGFITFWYGDETDIPTLDGGTADDPYWRVCDGTEGTPDLRGRCLIGAGTGSGLTNRAYNTTGGEEEHTLTVTEARIADHTHRMGVEQDGVAGAEAEGALIADGGIHTQYDSSRSTEDYASTKGVYNYDEAANDPHNNMPPWHALHCIMRTTRYF